MAAWPGGSIASMEVDNFKGGTDSWININESATAQQTVTDAAIDFSVEIKYTDHPYFDHGVGFFSVQLNRMTTSGWQVVESKSKSLGNDNDDGDWSDTITVSVTMAEEVEMYQLVLHCETQQTSFGTSADLSSVVQAVQGEAVVGDFTLDFLPMSIVYCPPGQDPIASSIPAEVRRRLLELDPFIHNLDQFFPDSGAALAVAANPYADPSAGNRAEMLGRWWLDTGSELNYSEGESRQLFQTYSNEVKYESTVTINASAGLNFEDIAASLGLTQSSTTSVGFQQSKETSLSSSRTASCFLIHNQNERDLDGIDIFYDKMFSTFMFRRVRRRREFPPEEGVRVGAGALSGRVSSPRSAPLRGLEVLLTGAGGTFRTSTAQSGTYTFVNLPPGEYRLEAGDQRQPVEIAADCSPEKPKPKQEGHTAKRAAVTGAAVGAGIGIWEVVKWTAAVLAAPESGGLSLGAAAVTP